jgi:hypothetical protein
MYKIINQKGETVATCNTYKESMYLLGQHQDCEAVHEPYVIRSGIIWLLITEKAERVFASQLFEVYKLHNDNSESLCMSHADVNDALECGLSLAIEVGREAL